MITVLGILLMMFLIYAIGVLVAFGVYLLEYKYEVSSILWETDYFTETNYTYRMLLKFSFLSWLHCLTILCIWFIGMLRYYWIRVSLKVSLKVSSSFGFLDNEPMKKRRK